MKQQNATRPYSYRRSSPTIKESLLKYV